MVKFNRKAWRLATPLLCLWLGTPSCKHQIHKATASSDEDSESIIATQAEKTDFKLYSTLAGKMARMEELFNSIDRFIDNEEFKHRLLKDAEEFLHLVTDCRELYPANLEYSDQAHFTRAINQTIESASSLNIALKQDHTDKAKQALEQLDEIRRKSHAQFSY